VLERCTVPGGPKALGNNFFPFLVTEARKGRSNYNPRVNFPNIIKLRVSVFPFAKGRPRDQKVHITESLWGQADTQGA